MDSPVFEPKSQGTIAFGGGELIKVQLENNMGYIVVDSLSKVFDVSRRTFQRRLARSELYGPYTAMIRIQTAGGPQPQLCLAAVAVPSFLAGVDLERVQSETGKELLKLFQLEVMDILAEHFGLSERDEMRIMRQQIAQLETRHQVRHEEPDLAPADELKKVRAEMAAMEKTHQEKVEQMRQAFASLRDQIRDYNKAAGEECITEEQQGEIYLAVETLGQLLEARGVVKPYPGIYMDVARISGRASYKQIPKNKYKTVLDFLNRQIETLAKPNSDQG